MQINSSQLHVFSEESNEFLHQRIEWQNFSLNKKQSEEHFQSHKSSKNSSKKRKSIVKQPKQGSIKTKIPKRQKDETYNTQMGRPSNENIQKDHLIINRSFNDIVYHFSRILIFLKLKQGGQTSNHAFLLQNNQSVWMSQAQHIMSQQNFPDFEEQKPSFLLHPNSLHYVFQWQKQRSKEDYNEQEIKYMLFAFLRRREMLTETVYHYINNYWPDIIYLVNNPDGDQQNHSQEEIQIEVLDMIQSEGQNRQNVNNNNRKQGQKMKRDNGQKKKINKQKSQIQILKKELQQDDSIAAYQISCYLYACCQKFKIKIDSHF